MKPLIFLPSPRDIPEFLDCASKLKYDKYWLKYYTPEVLAYREAHAFFMEHKEYTHFVILPDDLIVSPSDLETLLNYFRKVPNLKIVSGFCNIDTTAQKDLANICIEPVSHIHEGRQYYWLSFDQLADYSKKNKNKYGLVKVFFSGFPLMVVTRDVIEKITFRNDLGDGTDPHGCCLDVTFCWDVHQLGYEIFIDPDMRLNHLKVADGVYAYKGLHINPPKIVFEKN